MVATKIYTGESPVEEIQTAFKEEVGAMLKDAAVKMKCPVEQLKYRFDNMGQVEVQKMTLLEMAEELKKDIERKRIFKIQNRGNNGP